MFSPYWPYILLAVILMVLGTAVALYLVLRKARRRAAAPPAPAPSESKEVGFIEQGSSSSLALKVSFARAMRALRGHVTRRDYRYRLPWFLLVGEEHSGKTTLLSDSGMKLPLGRPAEQLHGVRQGVSWFFFDRGVVLDVAGELVLRSDCETSNARAWATLARLLQKHRPERPIDGVVLTIPCTDLIAGRQLAPDQRARIEQKATCLYRKLWQAQKQLGMSFPVYVVVTKCDQVPGFQGFSRELPRRLRDEMFGWSAPYTLETAYRPEWVGEAFQSVYRYLFQAQVELLAEHDGVEDRDRIFLLPSEMQQLRAPLQLYLDQIFKESSFHDSFFFRGLYFSGDAGEDLTTRPALTAAADPAAAPPEEWLEASPDPFAPPPPALEAPQERRPAFVRDLFEKKVFLEDMVARPLDKVRLSRNRTALVAQVLSLAIPITGCLGLLVTYAKHERRRDEMLQLLKQEEKDLGEVKASHGLRRSGPRISDFYEGDYRESSFEQDAGGGGRAARYAEAALARDAAGEGAPPADLAQAPGGVSPAPAARETGDNEQNLLTAMAKVESGSLYSVFIPSSWFSDLNERTRDSVVAGFKYVILDGLWHEVNEVTDSFLNARIQDSFYSASPYSRDAPVGPAAQRDGGRHTSPLYDQSYMPGDDGTLHGYIERFNDLRVNRARYESLIGKGSGTIENLGALATYLGHEPPAEGFNSDNRLFRRALQTAVGKRLEPASDKVQAAVKVKVAEMVEELYQRSFEGQTRSVSYAYLNDIAQTEALLSRPEYTWLSTYVFDARSSFHGMALSSGLRELRVALEGLSRESFMADGSPAAPRPRLPRRQMVWDGERLRHAAALCADYERFASGRGEYSKPLDESVRQAAHARLRANVTALVADAQRYQAVPPAAGQPAMLASLEAEVRSLRAEQETLSQLLAATDRLGFDPGLRQALSAQVSELVGDVDEQFRGARLYAAASKDFAWWDGSKPFAAPTFGAANTDELAAYLEAQRKRLSHLSRDLAAPLLNFASAQNIPVRSAGVPWGELLAALDSYDAKQPGNPLGTLEGFILVEMDKTDVGRCAELGGGLGASWSLDFFIRRRNTLLNSLRVRCAELAEARDLEARETAEARRFGALSNYREIADRFNATLGGRFPFGDPLGRPYADARTEDVLAFFRLFDQKLPAARAALADNRERLGDEARAAGEFLDTMERVRVLFAAAIEKKAMPALDFNVQFRVNRLHEDGASQIIDWTLDVGSTKYRYLDKEMDGRWVVGEPVRLTLRWANNSPVVPDAPTASPHFRARDRVAVFEYRDRWSLLTMLMRQRPTPSDFSPEGVDSEPSTLKFTVPTRPGGNLYDQQPDPLRAQPANVFMRLSLSAPGAKEPLTWPFPEAAPQLYYTRPRTAETR